MGKYGQRTVESIIGFLVAIICISYAIELFLSKPDWGLVGLHLLIPSLPNSEAVYIAVAMLGATVMPHVIYLHSQLVQCRNKDCSEEDKKKHLKMEQIDITIAMNIAFVINATMVIVSAAVFFRNGLQVDTIEKAHYSLSPLLGSLSSGVFGLALIASGLSSSAVGTMAGQTIMQGFVDIKISDTMGIRPYELFSGGEAFRIDFALRIAISKFLARRSGTSLQTLIIDEGFGSQDEEGLTHLMDAIYDIQDDFEKIIIVSHLPSMKSQFPTNFFVQKEADGSIVSVFEQG